MSESSPRVALVTGGSRGIGQAICLRLAADGFAVVVNYAGNAAKARETVQAIEARGGHARAIQGDVAEAGDVERLFAATQQAFGRLDVVVSNAGIMPLAPIAPEQVDTFDRVIATNLRGSYLVMAQAARRLGKGGRIVVLSTSVLAKSFPNYGAYIASKAGVEGLVHVLANELRGRDITVNAVAPGPTATELFTAGKSEELMGQIARQAPLERVGTPEEIAAAVAFLAGPDGSWVNSQVVRVNGGFA